MHELGLLCGLMPDLEHSSQQLSLVVDLIAGLGHRPGNSEPLEKLKEALSSKPSFQKHYLELSELAMGTYKHIGRIRSARLIGKDLATFYMKLGQPQNAEGFLMDALKTYKQEGWEMLADHTRLDLAECHRILDNHTKYVKTCVHIAASPVLSQEKRRFHQQGMVELAHKELEEPEYVRCRPVFLLQEATPAQESFVLNTECSVKLIIDVNLLEPIHCDRVGLSLNCQPLHNNSTDQSEGGRLSVMPERRTSQSGRRRHESTSSTSGINFYNHVTHVTKLAPSSIELQTYYERKSDKSVTTCGLQSKVSLRRTDSGSHQMVEVEVKKEEFGISLEIVDVDLGPGKNTVVLRGKPVEKGQYLLSQLCIQVGHLAFLKSMTPMGVSFAVVRDLPSLHIQSTSGSFYAGIPQDAMLTFHSGSYAFDNDLPVTLKLPSSVSMTGKDLQEDGSVVLSPARPYESQEFPLSIYAQPSLESCDSVKYKVTLECDAMEKPVQSDLDFKSSLKMTHKVHTCNRKKFIQVMVHCCERLWFELSDHMMTIDSRDVEVLDLLKTEQTITVNGDCSASYMWQLKNNLPDAPPLQCTFCVSYKQLKTAAESKTRKWNYPFTIEDYKTLYTVKCEVSPPEGQETCTAGALCGMTLKVKCLDGLEAQEASLMYEILPDENNWAVSGKTTGVFSLEGKQYQTSLDVMPLTSGYLPVPRVKLVKYNIPTQAEGTEDIKGEEEEEIKRKNPTDVMPELIPFCLPQVYNVSLGSQVNVLPAVNTTNVDITVAE